MKRKNPHFFNANRLFLTHLTLYICGTLLYWYGFVQEISYPGNAAVPRSVFEQTSMARLNFSLMWGLIILIHFGVLTAHNWRKKQQLNQVERNIIWESDHIESSDASLRLKDKAQDDSFDDITSQHKSLRARRP